MKTLKQLLLDQSEDGRYTTTRQDALDCVKEWLTQKRQEIEGRHYNNQAEYYHAKEPIIELIEELNQ